MAMAPHRKEKIVQAARVVVPLVVVIGLGLLVWRLAGDTAGQRREAPQMPVVALTPPPPPPPPPPTPKPPEPQDTVEIATPTPAPKTDSPKSDAPKQLTINGPAQAGTDAFGVNAGDGGGRSVGGDPNGSDDGGGGAFAEGAYRRLLAAALQTAIQSDDDASRLFFTAQVQVWVSPGGRVSKVVIAKSSGDARADRTLVAALMQAGQLDAPPPPNLKFPALVAVRGRRA